MKHTQKYFQSELGPYCLQVQKQGREQMTIILNGGKRDQVLSACKKVLFHMLI